MKNSKAIIFDIETDSLDVTKAVPKFYGFYDIESNETKISSELDEALHILKGARYVIGYNLKEFDLPILERVCGFRLAGKVIIDLYEILKKRQPIMTIKFKNLKLSTVVETLKLGDYKVKDFNYDILKKDIKSITFDELNTIYNYLIKDLKITYQLYQWVEKYFGALSELLSEDENERKIYLTSSSGAFAYRAICNAANLQIEYEDLDEDEVEDSYEGGYVLNPTGVEFHGEIYCLDFDSLYPNIFIQCNLFTPEDKCPNKTFDGKCPKVWTGGNFFKIKGRYCGCQQGIIELALQKLYIKRKALKKAKDERQYGYKIILNSMYGISKSKRFKSIYYEHTAHDCCAIGRACVKLAIDMFREAGFEVVYADTDSNYIVIPSGKTLQELLEVKDRLLKKLQSHMIFPW